MGMECRQAPAAQLGMLKALADATEAAAESDDPTRRVLLASWLQAWQISVLSTCYAD